LSLIGNDRQLFPTYGDNPNLDKYRAWLKSGFTQQALTSPTPVDPTKPGWYYAGTDIGLIAALVNSGFCGVDDSGAIVPPRIYRTVDFNRNSTTDGRVNFTGQGGTDPRVVSWLCEFSGVAGANDAGRIALTSGAPPLWTAATTFTVGDFVHSTMGDVYYCSSPGVTGATEPFTGSPPAATWPPTPGQTINDGLVGWTHATFSPIPTVIPYVSKAGITLSGSFSAFDNGTVHYVPSSPDGRADLWSRMWLVIPTGGVLGQPYKWGNGAGGFNGLWGGPPNGAIYPVAWGSTEQLSGQSLYGLLYTILQRWLGAHVRFIGAWISPSLNTELDSIPASPWSEVLGVTIDGNLAPFFRFNTESVSF
jgi:hypothetical protein